MQHDIEKPSFQDTLVDKEVVQTRYAIVLESLFEAFKSERQETTNELLWLRHSYEDMVNQMFDLTELIGRLAAKIKEWVGVAEESSET